MSRALLYDYWQYKLTQLSVDEILFSNRQQPYTENARIVYCSFNNSSTGLFRSGWSLSKNDNDLAGFLTHVFMPTAVFNWHEDVENLYIPMADMDTIQHHLGIDLPLEVSKLAHYLKFSGGKIEFNILNPIIDGLNRFQQSPEKAIQLKVFENMDDVYQAIVDVVEFDEVFLEEFGMTKSAFKNHFVNLQDNKFLSMQVISFLNSKIPYLI